jgi:hypothetical protein
MLRGVVCLRACVRVCVRVCQLLKVEKEVDKRYVNQLMVACRREKAGRRETFRERRYDDDDDDGGSHAAARARSNHRAQLLLTCRWPPRMWVGMTLRL